MQPLAQVQRIIHQAKLIAQYLGAEALDDHEAGLRQYQDPKIYLEVNLQTESILIASYAIDPSEPDQRSLVTLFHTTFEDPLGVYRPDIPLSDGSDWTTYLEQIEAAIPTPASPVLEFLRATANTPDVNLERVICNLNDLAEMGVLAAAWTLNFLGRLAQLPDEKKQQLILLLDAEA